MCEHTQQTFSFSSEGKKNSLAHVIILAGQRDGIAVRHHAQEERHGDLGEKRQLAGTRTLKLVYPDVSQDVQLL